MKKLALLLALVGCGVAQPVVTTPLAVDAAPTLPNPIYLAAKYWSVGPGGSDEAQCWGATQAEADAVRCATMSEINHRLTGWDGSTEGWYPGWSGPSIHLTGTIDAASFSVLTNLRAKNSTTFPRVYGDFVPVDAGSSMRTITAYQPAVPATDTERTVTIAGLGLAPQYAGMAMVSADGTKMAYVTRQPAPDQLAIAQVRVNTAVPLDAAIDGSCGVVGDFTVGDVVSIYNMITLPDWPYASDSVAFPVLSRVRLDILASGGSFPHGDMGNSSPYLTQVIFGAHGSARGSYSIFGGKTDASSNGAICNVQFTGSHNTLDGAVWMMNSVLSLDADASPFLYGSQLMFGDELNVTGGLFGGASGPGHSLLNFPEQNHAQIAMFNIGYPYGAFQLAPTSHHGGDPTDFYMDDGTLWYGHVPGAALALGPGALCRLNVGGITLDAPGSTPPGGGTVGQIFVNFGGLSNTAVVVKNFSDVPFYDLPSGTFVTGHQ